MSAPATSREQPVVLHVDDDAASLMMAEGALEDAGFTVIQASDGREALARFEESLPDLIIMDAVMPIMDGFEAIARIRQTASGAHVPILMITGLDDLDSITRAYDEGATDFLTKPINFFVLPHRVQYMLRSKTTADALRASESKLDNAQRIARLGHWEWRLEDGELGVSRGFERLVPALEALEVRHWQDLVSTVDEGTRAQVVHAAERAVADGNAFSVEFALRGESGVDKRTLRLEAEPLLDDAGRCSHMLGTLQDITEQRDAQAQIHNLAYYDLVTGLANRAQLHERLRITLAKAERGSLSFALLFLDLDHFKQVNDTLGHDAGDALLVEVARRITDVVRDSDTIHRPGSDTLALPGADPHTIARLGGDEFVVLLDEVRRPEDAARVAERIAATIRDPYLIGENEVRVTTTIGISVYPADGLDCETLMKHADVAMYHAKEQGRDGFQFYSHGIHEAALARFSMERELRAAIEGNELTLAFQPKVFMRDGSVSGAEVLVRWEHPVRGTISPGEFIPLAEETGLILPLGQWVLRSACSQMQTWIEAGLGPFPIAVNCSPVQFTRGNMVREVEEAIASSGLDARWLEIELTESLLMQDIEEGIANLEAMKALGVRVSIDDFGTGFSSLSYLKRLPADKLKIDRSFVIDLARDSGDAAIVAAIVSLSHDLGLTVVAEGVETREQYDLLSRFGCDESQGYLISYPLDAIEFAHWLRRHESTRRAA